MYKTKSEITALLEEWGNGDPEALGKLMPLVFEDVRSLARRYLSHEAADHTLQPTALVNEVYLKLTGLRQVEWQNRVQFFGFLAELMRRILVDHARRHLSAKRGSGQRDVSFDESRELTEIPYEDMIALDDALADLAAHDSRKCRIVELRFFVGLTQAQIAEVLDISHRTVNREWRKARLWLHEQLRAE